MPAKFVAEVLKGLFGVSETSTDEAETETNITVERETGGDEPDAVESPEPGTDEDEPDAVESPEPETDEDEPDAVESPEGTGEPVDEITGIGPTYSGRLANIGVETVGDLTGADVADIAEAAEVSESRAADWITQAEDR